MNNEHTSFDDVLAANDAYAQTFDLHGLQARAARGLAVVTCMDSRIDPLAMLGLNPGDAKIIRNAGARVTEDVLRTLVLGAHLLGVERIMVVAHTNCKMASATRDQVIETIETASGVDVRSLDFGLVADQRQTLENDTQKIRSWPFLPPGIAVGGFIYDVATGRLEPAA
ncbi:carbonic anhydrase [Actinobacteria bacterium YIM 96077]|uniref:carbonic anhydrase n=1 Tax=Phytoactinopolyspora halophila TaxID=1981511 RepID=A0A329QJD9_9ACTN|nr:carbonic anhydrase [Phytoactinopolyspora halophila]AYY13511.1 carbonic anhydrase [Actinobacteria bacterium YIM 96077]RAW12434.1 carbonic anhydrase [Phytoactinopolyspora halophila]